MARAKKIEWIEQDDTGNSISKDRFFKINRCSDFCTLRYDFHLYAGYKSFPSDIDAKEFAQDLMQKHLENISE